MVVFARGCDVVNKRQSARLQAKLSLEKSAVSDGFDAEVAEAREDLDGRELREELDDIREDHEKKVEKLKEEWRDLEIDARDARAHAATWSYWLEWLFVLGTLALCIGLVGTALSGTGPKQTVALGILGIIVFSIYVGGMAWVSTVLPPSF